jgi:membrane-associated protease RseP (regulator of RpoE activity)
MRKEYKTYLIQGSLFIVTIITTTFAGMDWMGFGELTWENFCKGLLYSIPFLTILTVHEFGHYIASRIYKLSVTLPYYIPFYIPFLGPTIGTLGAFIRIKSPLQSKKMVMDVGIAGPLAGFIVAIGVLWYGYAHLPAREYIFQIHPSYKEFGLDYEKHVYNYNYLKKSDSIAVGEFNKRYPEYAMKWEKKKEYEEMYMGKSLLMLFMEKYVVKEPSLIPNKYEIMHYPFIFAGFLALFFTALNLLPIGQLDGGHVLYGLLGSKKHFYVSRAIFIALIFLSGLGIFKNRMLGDFFGNPDNMFLYSPLYLFFLYFLFGRMSQNWKNNLLIAVCVFAAQFFTQLVFPSFNGISSAYLFFGLLVGRFLGLDHPPTYFEENVSLSRKILGWISLIIFVICFTPDFLQFESFRPF